MYKLWSDGKTEDSHVEIDASEVIYNLFEDVRVLNEDRKRLDWLADKDNKIGNIQLPTKCVEGNLSSLRDAIDDAMLL